PGTRPGAFTPMDGCSTDARTLALLQVDSAGTVHVAWWTGEDTRIGTWYARSADGGVTFGTPVQLSEPGYSTPAHPQLALPGDGRVVAAWDDGAGGTSRILVRISRDGGARWSGPLTMSDTTTHASFPVVNASSGGLAVAWSQKSHAEAHHAAAAMPDMKDPDARKPLTAVGDAQVMLRRATRQ